MLFCAALAAQFEPLYKANSRAVLPWATRMHMESTKITFSAIAIELEGARKDFPSARKKDTNNAHARGTTPVMAIMDLDPCKSPYVQLLFLFAAQANVAGAVRPVQLELQYQPWRERTNASCEATVHP